MPTHRNPRRSLVVRADGPCDSPADARRDMSTVMSLSSAKWDRAQRVTVQFYGRAPAGSYVSTDYLAEVQDITFNQMGIPELHLCNIPEQDLDDITDPRVVYGLLGPSEDREVDMLLVAGTKSDYVTALRPMLARLTATPSMPPWAL